MKIELSDLVLRDSLQTRVDTHPDAIEDYAAAYSDDAQMPAIEVMEIDGRPHVVDGFHRVAAAIAAGLTWVRVTHVRGATLEDAMWHAASRNSHHGLRRSSADKRRAVWVALDSGTGMEVSDNVLAEHCGVSRGLVSAVRAEYEARCEIHAEAAGVAPELPSKRTGADGKSYPVQRQPAPATEPSDDPPPDETTANDESEAHQLGTWLAAVAADTESMREALLGMSRQTKTMPWSPRAGRELAKAMHDLRGGIRANQPVLCSQCDGVGCVGCRDRGWRYRYEDT